MKITPSKSQSNTGVVRMEFEWLDDSRTSNKRDEIAPPRSPRLPAPRKVTRICGNLATSRWLIVRCGRVQVAGGGRIGRCRCWVNRVTLSVGRPLPVYLDERTSSGYSGMSGWCQDRK